MSEGGLTSASSLPYLPDKTAGSNNLNESESNAALDDGRKVFEEIWMKQFTQNSLPITFTSYEPNSKAKNKTYLQS